MVTRIYSLAYVIGKKKGSGTFDDVWAALVFLVIDIDEPKTFVSDLGHPYVKGHVLSPSRGGIPWKPEYQTIIAAPSITSVRGVIVDKTIGSKAPVEVFESD